MKLVGTTSNQTYSTIKNSENSVPSSEKKRPQSSLIQPTNTKVDTNQSPIKVKQNQITLSTEGKALLNALQQIEHEDKTRKNEDKSVGDQVESFTHGALGIDHPDKIEQVEDDSYSAGQYTSAALSLGGILLAII
ncbi:hypothetical protein [Vibrio sagamiensis]|uniref:Uncharacterized protein n=1 Tax=Vibrio sagamiensis NBRC 104589 TaxID=1219064 RepID=A0A511QB07_9VIBR|nr:hypothetical protein [Vibrio sagamiensis]PNQ68376.1 hypothetical protein C1141_07210 [Vibrio agarivorans]GEM74438.1 hypothetical protein VSA01S_05500 [Vibrio sagamiensis NBRC 104589]